MDDLWSSFDDTGSNSFGDPIDLTNGSDDVISCDDLTPTIPASSVQVPVVIDLTQDSDMTEQGTSTEKFVRTFLLVLHSHRCRLMEPPGYMCTIRECGRAKQILGHMNTCSDGLDCSVDGCREYRRYISHWKDCSDVTCSSCGQLRARLEEFDKRKRQENQTSVANPVSVIHQPVAVPSVDTPNSVQIIAVRHSAPTERNPAIETIQDNRSPNEILSRDTFTTTPTYNNGVDDSFSSFTYTLGATPLSDTPTIQSSNQPVPTIDHQLPFQWRANTSTPMTHNVTNYQPAHRQSNISTQNAILDLSNAPVRGNQAGTQMGSSPNPLSGIHGLFPPPTTHSSQNNSPIVYDELIDLETVQGAPAHQPRLSAFTPVASGPEPAIPEARMSQINSSQLVARRNRMRMPLTSARWCRQEHEIRVHLTCLRDPRTRSVRHADLVELQRLGLGIAFLEEGSPRRYTILFTDWSRSTLDDYIRDVFPALQDVSFVFCTARGQGVLNELPVEYRTVEQLRSHFLSENRRTIPNIYIRPCVRLTQTEIEQAMRRDRGSPTLDDLSPDPEDMAPMYDSDDDESSPFERIVHIKRSNIVKDMLTAFNEPSILQRRVRVVLVGEEAEDAGGVFRDVLSDFWSRFLDQYFDGEHQAVPRISVDMPAESWAAVGRIMYRGYSQEKYIPLRFCRASLAYTVLGKLGQQGQQGQSEDHEVMLLDSFLDYLPADERSVLKKALQISQFPSGFSDRLVEELLDILSRFGLRSRPTPDNIRSLALRSAEIALFERPYFPLHHMDLTQLKEITHSDFSSVSSIEQLYKRMKPDGTKVSEQLVSSESSCSSQIIFGYLKRAVQSFSEDLVSKFLRFVTGSDVISGRKIGVEFVHVAGLQRRFVAHTCGPSLDVPITYYSYEEFYSELQTQLLSDHWEMEFV